MISLFESDDRHIVLRLWRKKGDGYAIVLERVTVPRTAKPEWEYCVYRENCDQPRSYDSYSKNERNPHARSIDIEVYEGKQLLETKRFYNIIRVIDIELSKAAMAPINESEQLLKKTMIDSQYSTEMAHGRTQLSCPNDRIGPMRRSDEYHPG
jgi:hypothetical protein